MIFTSLVPGEPIEILQNAYLHQKNKDGDFHIAIATKRMERGILISSVPEGTLQLLCVWTESGIHWVDSRNIRLLKGGQDVNRS